MKNPIYVALDTDSIFAAEELLRRVEPYVGGFKVGLEFYATNGPQGVEKLLLRTGLPVFLDLKLHDIPNTVGKAMKGVADLEPAITTLHVGGGVEMMRAAKEAAHPKTRVVGVTILTSLDQEDLNGLGMQGSPAEHVVRMTNLASQAGIDGIVCSPHEVDLAKQAWGTGYFVIPGIRPEGSDNADQKRVMTPREALAKGASVLVIGRPITAADDPALAAQMIAEQIGAH